MVDVAAELRKARLRWYGHEMHVISNDQGKRHNVLEIAETMREARLRRYGIDGK